MPEHTLNDQEAAKLFNQVMRAEAADDTDKLEALMNPSSSLEEDEKEKSEEPEASEEADASQEDTSTQSEQQETPQTSAENTEEQSPDDGTEEELDDLAKLKAELDKVKKENHGLKSQAGRVPYMQSRLREIDKKLEELTKAGSTPSNLPSTKIAPALQEKLKSIERTDPELAKAIIESVVTATDAVAVDTITREQEALRAQREQYSREYAQDQLNVLLQEYPNAPEVFKSDSWKQWKTNQSDGVQRLAGSMEAREVALAFELYTRDLTGQISAQGPAAPAAANSKAAEIEAERNRKKENAPVVKSPAAPAKIQMSDDPEKLFEQMFAQAMKEQGR